MADKISVVRRARLRDGIARLYTAAMRAVDRTLLLVLGFA